MIDKKEYRKNYIKKSIIIVCPICGSKFKKVYQYNHNKSKNHLVLQNFLLSFNKDFYK